MARVVLKSSYGEYLAGDVLSGDAAKAFLDKMPPNELYVKTADEETPPPPAPVTE